MAVSKKLKAIYNGFFDGIETFAANTIQIIQEERDLRRYIDKSSKLTAEQKKSVKKLWGGVYRVSPKWALYYSAKNGQFDPRYIPNTLYYTKIDQHFNARKLGYGFNDKNYYSKIFADIKQPKVLVRKINGMVFDENYNQISVEDAFALITSENEVICKPSQETGSGRGIQFFSKSDIEEIRKFLNDRTYDDYIVQALIKQHPTLNEVHEGSINTYRICSLLMEDGVHILSSVLRMGVGSSKVDNATAKDNAKYDGMTCGIDEFGKLKKYAYGYHTGQRYEQHPDGLVFEGFQLPAFDKAIELVKQAHPRIAHFRLVSWDIAIDEDGEAVLVEANMRKGGINFHQFNNGPLFGELTEKVLDEVFKKG